MGKVIICANLTGKLHLMTLSFSLSIIIIHLLIITIVLGFIIISHPYNYYVLYFYSLLVVSYHLGWMTIAWKVHMSTKWDWRTQKNMALL